MSDNEKHEHELHMQMLAEQTSIRPDAEIPYPTPIISRDEFEIKQHDGTSKFYPKPFGTYGNFSFIQAPPKHKKSFLISLMTSIYLNGKVSTAPGFIGNRDGKQVLHFDTEQGDYHAHRAFKNTDRLAERKNTDDYHTYALRALDYKTRVDFIEYCIFEKHSNVGLVVIDGIIDLINDANDLKQSEAIVQKLLTWSKKAECHIICVIHTTGMTEKPTGHLGTFLERKCEMQLHLSKNPKHHGHIDVKCKSTRGFTPDDFSFYVNDYGLPEISGFCYDEILDYLSVDNQFS